LRGPCECECECEREYLISVQIGCASDVSHLSYKLELKTTANFGPPKRPRAASRPSSLFQLPSAFAPLIHLIWPHRALHSAVSSSFREITRREGDLNITAIDTDVGVAIWSASFALPVFRSGSGRWRWQRRLSGSRGRPGILHRAPGAAVAKCGTAAGARAFCCNRATSLSTGGVARRGRRRWAPGCSSRRGQIFSRRSTLGWRPWSVTAGAFVAPAGLFRCTCEGLLGSHGEIRLGGALLGPLPLRKGPVCRAPEVIR
jgi:hypothetical protein